MRTKREFYRFSLSAVGNVEEAVKHIRQKEKAYSWLRVLRWLPDYESKVKLLSLMRQSGLRPDNNVFDEIISCSPDYLSAEQWVNDLKAEGLEPSRGAYISLIRTSPDFATARSWFNIALDKGHGPHLGLFNTLLAKASNYLEGKKLLDGLDIAPDLVTYNILLAKASTPAQGRSILAEMRGHGIAHDAYTATTLSAKVGATKNYDVARDWFSIIDDVGARRDPRTVNALISKVPDFQTARDVMDEQQERGFKPNIHTFAIIFSKDLSGQSSRGILEWFHKQPSRSDRVLQIVIAAFRRDNRIDDALEIALNYPHLPTAQQLFHDFSDDILPKLKVLDRDIPNHPNAAYSLGIAYMLLGKPKDALPLLQKALHLATATKRKQDIQNRIREIEAGR